VRVYTRLSPLRKRLTEYCAAIKRMAEATSIHTVAMTTGGRLQKENNLLHALLRGIEQFRVASVDPSLVLATEVFTSRRLPA
jgi:hypothetical protein